MPAAGRLPRLPARRPACCLRTARAYPQILRGESYVWWRSLLGAVFGLSMFLLLTGVVSQAVVTLVWALTAGDYPYADYFREAFAFERPVGMLATNLGHRHADPDRLGADAGRAPGPAALAELGPAADPLALPARLPGRRGGGAERGAAAVEPGRRRGCVFSPQPGFWGFLVVILLTSPLQAIAEEVFFRGYLMQALGSLVAQPWFGVVVSAVVFALLHGVQNPPLFVARLAFGLLAGVLVWRTGGLEAGIAAHIVNNVCAYGIAGLTTSIASLKAIREITWADAGVRRRRVRTVRRAGVRVVPAAAAANRVDSWRRPASRFGAYAGEPCKVAPRVPTGCDHLAAA